MILAGGLGTRMGGCDKGLVELDGRPLFHHVLDRLRPQVDELLIVANRNAAVYQRAGVRVVGDDVQGSGPLGGIATALHRATTAFVLIAPCDAPLLPATLSERFQRAREREEAELFVAHTGDRLQPLFALLRVELLPSLRRFLAGPERAVHAWYGQERMQPVDFSDCPEAFMNLNTRSEHASLARRVSSSSAPPARAQRAEPRMVSLEEALACYDREVSPLRIETVRIDEALHRVLATAPMAQSDLPPFSQSAMDGYALRSDDTRDAGPERPVRLEVTGALPAGPHARLPALAPGETLRIFTGAPLPEGSDAVIRQEAVRREGRFIFVGGSVPSRNDVRNRGEELERGTALATPGRHITPGMLAAFAMAGVELLEVHRRPRIHVLVTGDEIVSSGPLRLGEVHDANGRLIRAWVLEHGGPEPFIEHVGDEPEAVESALAGAWQKADLVLTSGGVSVGERDWVPRVAERLGATPLFKKVAQRPGKPLYFARRDGRFLLGLPGNPAAALVGLVVHARRILDRLEGRDPPGPTLHPGRLAEPVSASGDRARLVRARREITPEGIALHPLGKQDAHMLSNLSEADALVVLPPGPTPLERGALVSWTPLGRG